MKTRHAHMIRLGIMAARNTDAARDVYGLNGLTRRAFIREATSMSVTKSERDRSTVHLSIQQVSELDRVARERAWDEGWLAGHHWELRRTSGVDHGAAIHNPYSVVAEVPAAPERTDVDHLSKQVRGLDSDIEFQETQVERKTRALLDARVELGQLMRTRDAFNAFITQTKETNE